MQEKQSILKRILSNPFTSILGMVVGGYLGFTNNALGRSLAVYGEAFQILLKMTVLPILLTAIITSLGKFISNTRMRKMLSRIVFTLAFMTIIYGALGIGVGLVFQPGNLSEENREIISRQVSLQSEVLEIDLDSNAGGNIGDVEFLNSFLPENIFKSLTNNSILAVLVFAILFGIAIGSLPGRNKERQVVLHFFEEMYEVFSKIVSFLMLVLPLALVCIVSSEIAKSGFDIILSSRSLILLFYICGFALILINTIILSVSVKKNFFQTLASISFPTIVAFTTRNSIASMAVAIETLHKKFDINKGFARIAMPLMMILGRFGNVFYFGLVAIFSTQVYFTETNLSILIFICFSVVLAGIATAGASGFATLAVLGLVLEPIGVPFDTILIILLIIDVIIDPLRTALIVHTNTVLTGVLHGQYLRKRIQEEERNQILQRKLKNV